MVITNWRKVLTPAAMIDRVAMLIESVSPDRDFMVYVAPLRGRRKVDMPRRTAGIELPSVEPAPEMGLTFDL